jgi:hypothetical protein
MENPAPKGATEASARGSTGVYQDRGMCGEKRRRMNRFSIAGTLNSGGPECVPSAAARRPEAVGDQPQGGANRTFRESDPPIVVRDGSTGHMAKERAGEQREQRNLRGTRILPVTVSNSLLAKGNGDGRLVLSPLHSARFPEEPGAVIPHAGICEGGTGQPVSLPQ